uniref:Uncharacterized protein n=1 Tax=Cannabis sativa TaxID=3483 RepID=A0A803NTH0_CANSA
MITYKSPVAPAECSRMRGSLSYELRQTVQLSSCEQSSGWGSDSGATPGTAACGPTSDASTARGIGAEDEDTVHVRVGLNEVYMIALQ